MLHKINTYKSNFGPNTIYVILQNNNLLFLCSEVTCKYVEQYFIFGTKDKTLQLQYFPLLVMSDGQRSIQLLVAPSNWSFLTLRSISSLWFLHRIQQFFFSSWGSLWLLMWGWSAVGMPVPSALDDHFNHEHNRTNCKCSTNNIKHW